ncbi:unnamed protein product [Schistosoma mattheei]|uniref:Uncharacterized protein n=1 Tax=Schistosoma mattheei TaxID=31246 RepID=A0A3P8KV20_9TREM|nr:unnamed protein product [Schistosoma mattheei]
MLNTLSKPARNELYDSKQSSFRENKDLLGNMSRDT